VWVWPASCGCGVGRRWSNRAAVQEEEGESFERKSLSVACPSGLLGPNGLLLPYYYLVQIHVYMI
jgi:hypothetical protein